MTQVKDLVGFRRDLFFDGAVQIGWFEKNPERRDQAAAGFVFHGPAYHGISEDDLRDASSAPKTDTARFTAEVAQSMTKGNSSELPIALAIAGYGTGKSHLALTLGTLFSNPKSEIADLILGHIEEADAEIGRKLRHQFTSFERPFLVLAINGMGNFDLSAELSRQVLVQMRAHGVITQAIEELSPRFQIAERFVERNYELRNEDFIERFGAGSEKRNILVRLQERDEDTYIKVNEIYEIINGTYINAIGQETPQELIQTVCQTYCGENGPFQGLLILFDEFGRYLEFAADRPHIAGDAALQQLFQGVQDNADRCFMLCLVQYDLKVYLQRISRLGQSSIQRYVTRYDAAKKYYLSSNLETLIAHLIKKRDESFLQKYLFSSGGMQVWRDSHKFTQRCFPKAERYAVWRDTDRFRQVIVQGCWPLSPFATWFLCRNDDILQDRTTITIVKDILELEANRSVPETDKPWAISASQLCLSRRGDDLVSPLVNELVAKEEDGGKGAVAQAYKAVEERYHNDLSDDERHALISILIAAKIGIKVKNQEEVHQALSMVCDLPVERLKRAVEELSTEYGVIEWNDRFNRYEIIGDAVPRSAFLTFLRQKTQQIPAEQVEEIFAAHMKNWAGLGDLDPDFSTNKRIDTTEWRFQTFCSQTKYLRQDLENAFRDWKSAIKPDSCRGQLIYAYLPRDAKLELVRSSIETELHDTLQKAGCTSPIPLLIVLMQDEDGGLGRALSELFVLSTSLAEEDKQRFGHFIENHKLQLQDELQRLQEELTKKRLYILPPGFDGECTRLQPMTRSLFEWAYPKAVPFPFDGLKTARGNGPKDCREIAAELFKGTLNFNWISSRPAVTQNRARSLLQSGPLSWGVLDQKGDPTLYPSHKGIREIIVWLDSKLKEEKRLRLGDVFASLTAPPYGFNIASAAILMAAFVAPRQDSIAFMLGGQETTPASWVGKALSANFLDLAVLNASELRYVLPSEAGEWVDLLSRWDLETAHERCVEYMDEADSLRERIPLPSGALYERWKRLQEKAESSLKILENYGEQIEKQESSFERAYERQDAGSLGWIGKTLAERYQNMRREKEFWTGEQLSRIQELIERVRVAVMQFFEPWLRQQNCLSAAQVGDFRHRMIDQACRNLNALNLPDLAGKLERHVQRVIGRVEEQQRLLYIVERANAFLTGRRVSGQSKVAELKEWRKECNSLTETLQQARAQNGNVPEIDKKVGQLQIFQRTCTEQIQKHKQRSEQLWNLEICDVQAIRNAHSEVKDLMIIYAGEEVSAEDLSTMVHQLVQFDTDFTLWSDLNIPTADLHSMIEKRISESESLESNDDDAEPVWPPDEVYKRFAEHVFTQRKQAAEDWINKNCTDPARVTGMRAEDCQMLLQRINRAPAYLEPAHMEVVNKLCKCAEKRLDKLQVEGLLARFRSLPPALQKQFLDIATAELMQKSGT
jgi:hypothetical protein